MKEVRETELQRSSWIGIWQLFAIFAIAIRVLPDSFGLAQPATKNVLVLFSADLPSNAEFLNEAEPAMRARVSGPITFYSSFLVINLAEEKAYQESQAETFQRTYAGVKLDLVIAVAPQAVLFALQYRDKMFPGVPIVFTAIGTREFGGRVWPPDVTGVTTPIGIGETIDLALRLHPDTEALAILQGPDWFWLAAEHAEMLRYQGKVKVIDVIGPPTPEMLNKARALPPHTVVLFHIAPGPESSHFGARELLAGVTQLWPTYAAWQANCLNHGCIGGAYPDDSRIYLSTAEIAARVLKGERPESIPVIHDSGVQVRVDSRQLQRWHIPESALPAGSVMLYRPSSLWEQGRKYFVAAMVVIATLILLIAGLLWERARKRKAEAALRESEKRFRVMADTTPALVWMCDAKGKDIYLNEQRIAFTGPHPKQGCGDSWSAFVHPDDLRNARDEMAQGLNNHRAFSREYRFRRSDGAYRWIFDVASPRVNEDGAFGGFIGSAIDVTEQKLAQQALEKVSGQLIEAQEKERTRIARELHDDICQRLAVLSMEIDRANRSSDGARPDNGLAEIRQHCSDIAGDVQSLSHQLHSSKLEYLGVVAAIRGFCHEFSKQHGVRIEFTESNSPPNLGKDLSLCLFRVAQEALHNAVKYSGVDNFTVELIATESEVQLCITDSGAGFDIEAAMKKRGLGLVSMQERLHLVSGRLSIESTPGHGTKVLAIAPTTAQISNSSKNAAMEESLSTI